MGNLNYYIKNTLNLTYDSGINNHPEHNSNPLYWEDGGHPNWIYVKCKK